MTWSAPLTADYSAVISFFVSIFSTLKQKTGEMSVIDDRAYQPCRQVGGKRDQSYNSGSGGKRKKRVHTDMGVIRRPRKYTDIVEWDPKKKKKKL